MPIAVLAKVKEKKHPVKTLAAAFLAAHLAEAFVWLAIWQSAGQASLSSQLGIDWLWGWTLLLAVLVPMRIWAARSRGRFFSRLTAVEGVETRALSGGLAALISIVELALASELLTLGGNGGLLLAVFLAWALLATAAGWRYACERDRWSTAHFAMPYYVSHDGVPALGRYLDTPERIHQWSDRLNSFGPAAWLSIGVLALMPALSAGASSARLAIGLGGVLLAYQALRSALGGVSNLIESAISRRSTALRDDVSGCSQGECRGELAILDAETPLAVAHP
jgi:ATP-binding cassette subfamily B protein